MRRDINYAFALLGDIKEPGGTTQRFAGNVFEEVMHALLGYRRMIDAAFDQTTEDRGVVDQRLLQDRSNLITLRHDVVEQQVFCCCGPEARLELFETGNVNAHRLVGQDMEAGIQAAFDVINLVTIIAGNDDDITRPFGQHPLEEIGADVELFFPLGRVRGSCVIGFDTFQMFVQVGARRGVNRNGRRNRWIHNFLHQRRVEMTSLMNPIRFISH